jgi:hypothetical protein
MSPSLDEIRSWTGHDLDGVDGAPVGRVEGAYIAEGGERVDWMLCRMGRFGHHCLVPTRDAVGAAGHVWVPYQRAHIRRAPRIEPGDSLTREREEALIRHYRVAGEAQQAASEPEPRNEIAARPAP